MVCFTKKRENSIEEVCFNVAAFAYRMLALLGGRSFGPKLQITFMIDLPSVQR